MRSKSASGWSSYGSSSIGCSPAARAAADVHRHRIADVGDVVRGRSPRRTAGRVRRSPGRAWRRRRHGCRRRHARGRAVPSPTWHTPLARQHLGDLAAGVRDHADRHTGSRQRRQRLDALGDRPPPQVGVARAVQQRRRQRRRRLGHADAAHVRVVVLVPERLAAAGCRLRRHARVVGATVRVDRRIAAVVRQQRAEHRGVGQHQHAAGIEQDRP